MKVIEVSMEQRWENGRSPGKTHRPKASSSTIHTCENPERPGRVEDEQTEHATKWRRGEKKIFGTPFASQRLVTPIHQPEAQPTGEHFPACTSQSDTIPVPRSSCSQSKIGYVHDKISLAIPFLCTYLLCAGVLLSKLWMVGDKISASASSGVETRAIRARVDSGTADGKFTRHRKGITPLVLLQPYTNPFTLLVPAKSSRPASLDTEQKSRHRVAKNCKCKKATYIVNFQENAVTGEHNLEFGSSTSALFMSLVSSDESSSLNRRDATHARERLARDTAAIADSELVKWLDFSPPIIGETGFDSRHSRSAIFAYENRTGRCHWSAVFLRDLPFLPPFHSGEASHSPRVALIDSQDLDVKLPLKFSTPLKSFCDDGSTARQFNALRVWATGHWALVLLSPVSLCPATRKLYLRPKYSSSITVPERHEYEGSLIPGSGGAPGHTASYSSTIYGELNSSLVVRERRIDRLSPWFSNAANLPRPGVPTYVRAKTREINYYFRLALTAAAIDRTRPLKLAKAGNKPKL
ncbi:hypothetical protein PR048_014228 [Dryococelus australis]|uniref:Uncharacterized protein n=1 Tax=Dryococelus australis TaxID=614101 RepID=A0ABQ9HDJ7_9NEOP|nr:hypothetical protein PR048_014228 [Dryococelus australis]